MSFSRHAALRWSLLAFVLALSYFKWLSFPWRQPVVALIAVSLVVFVTREPLASIGCRWPVPIASTVALRGFLLHEVGALFGQRRAAEVGSVVLGAALFGLSHHTQGPVGMLLTGLTGLLMGALFLASRRNIWTIVLGHGWIDTWGVLTLYLGWY